MSAQQSETLSCRGCDSDWTRLLVRGRKPSLCPTCRRGGPPKVIDLRPREKGLAIASRLTDYRLAIEIASSAIRLGRYADALEALDAAVGKYARAANGRGNQRGGP